MSDDNGSVEAPTVFSRESATELVRKQIEQLLSEETYRSAETGEWMRLLSKSIIEALISLSDQYKFMSTTTMELKSRWILPTNVTLCQKKQAGIHSNTSAIYDSSTDQSFMVRWENKHLIVIVAIFAVQL